MLKKWLALALKLGVSVALIWFLLRGIDFEAAWARAALLEWYWPVLAIFLLLAVQVAIAAYRWGIVMDAIRAPLPFAKLWRLFLIGAFFNQALPGAVGGDAVRIYKSYKAGLRLGQAINGVMLERVITVFALILLVVCVQPLLFARIESGAVRWAFPLLALAGLAGIAVLMFLDRLPERLHGLRLVRGLMELAGDTRRLFLSPRYGPAALVVAGAGHVNVALAVWVLALGLDIGVSALDCIILIPPVLLIMTLPISIAGWGVREGAMVTAFGFIGVPAESALVLSLLFGVVNLVAALPGGALWFLERDRRVDVDLVENAR